MVQIEKTINSLEEYTGFINEISTKTHNGQKKLYFLGEKVGVILKDYRVFLDLRKTTI